MGNFWDERYSEEGFAYGDEPSEFLLEVLPRLPPGRALCLAEGEGRNAVFLAQQGFETTAMDLSPVGLRKAAELAAARGVPLNTVVADLADYEMGVAQYDVVVAIWAHLPKPLLTQVHRSAVEALAQGGALVIESYTPAQLQFKTGGPQEAEMLQTLEELLTNLGGLDVEVGVERTRMVAEGRYHRGESAVVQLLAFKR